MSLIFISIYREGMVLADYSNQSGTFEQVGLELSKECTHKKASYNKGQYVFHTILDQKFVYLCMTDVNYMRSDAYSFLEQIKNLVYTKCPDEISSKSVAYGLQKKLRNDIIAKFDLYNSPDASKIRRAQTDLDETKNVVMQNLDKVLQRQERLEILVQKSSNQKIASSKMRSQANAIRRQQKWKRIKLLIIIGLGALLLIYFIMVFACGGFDLHTCFGGEDDDKSKEEPKKLQGTQNMLEQDSYAQNVQNLDFLPQSNVQQNRKRCLASSIKSGIENYFK